MTDTTTAEPGPAADTARRVSDAFAPAHCVIAILLLIGWHSTPGTTGLAWGALAALFCGAVPLAVLRIGVRTGRLTDRHIRHRRQRLLPLLAMLASVTAGVTLLIAGHAPRELLALTAAMFAGLAVTTAVTAFWKVSFHTAVSSGAVTVAALAYGPAVLPLALLVAVIGWSRVILRDHTPAQAAVGALVGATTAAAVFGLLG